MDNPENLDFWLANRSIEKLEAMIFEEGSKGFVCVEDNTIVGISHIKKDGELTLCYVHPAHPDKGIGSKILVMVESQARHWGVKEITLVSTATAKPFYEYHGYTQSADEVLYFRMPGYPMKKQLMIHDSQFTIDD